MTTEHAIIPSEPQIVGDSRQYILVRNKGLAPIESFTILGLSTARGEADKIGQFGSGSKHGILTLIRAGITPRIFIGNDEIVFSTHPARMLEKDYLEVRYTFRGEQHKTGMCLEFGALDWDTPGMALREFICNAIDQGEVIQDCLKLRENPKADAEETRIFIPLENEALKEYWLNIKSRFLHYEGLENNPVIPARSAKATLFRRGVMVREMECEHPPIFHYNFQSEKIDESRNMNDGSFSQIAAALLRKSQKSIETILSSFGGEKRWEHGLGYSVDDYMDATRATVKAAWTAVFGDKPFAAEGELRAALCKKSIQHIVVPQQWEGCLERSGIVHGCTLLNGIDSKGGEVFEPNQKTVNTFRTAWGWLEKVRLTNGKPFPEVKNFSMPMNCGNETIGYYKDGTVFLNIDYDGNEQAALEELAHYITGAEDETRDFQDFAFKVATRMANHG